MILIETFIGEKMKLATYDKDVELARWFRAPADKLNKGQVIIDFVRLLEVEGSRKSYPDTCW